MVASTQAKARNARAARVLVIATIALLLASCSAPGSKSSGKAPASGNRSDRSKSKTLPSTTQPPRRLIWKDYFGPTEVGATCTRSATSSVNFGGGTPAVGETDTITARGTTPRGIDVSEHVATDGTAPLDLRYELRSDGTLATPGFQGERSGLNVKLNGFVVYPKLSDLISGHSASGVIQAVVSGLLSSPMNLRLGYLVSPLRSVPVVTNLGQFADVVGVHVALTSIDSDLPATVAQQLHDVFPVVQGFTASTIWWARNTGIVKLETAFGQVELKGCSGPGTALVAAQVHPATAPPPASTAFCSSVRELKSASDASNTPGPGSSDDYRASIATLSQFAPVADRLYRKIGAATTGNIALDADEVRELIARSVRFAHRATTSEAFLNLLESDVHTAEATEASKRFDAYTKRECGLTVGSS